MSADDKRPLLEWGKQYGPYRMNVQKRDGMFGWEASTPGYCGWQSDGVFETEELAQASAREWLWNQGTKMLCELYPNLGMTP